VEQTKLQNKSSLTTEVLLSKLLSYPQAILSKWSNLNLYYTPSASRHSPSRNGRNISTSLIIIKLPVKHRFHDFHDRHMSSYPACDCSTDYFIKVKTQYRLLPSRSDVTKLWFARAMRHDSKMKLILRSL
jgi:hypothetical protein